jgi:mRNA interferase HigB
MRIIKAPTIRGYWQSHPGAETFPANWLKVAKGAAWRNLQEVRRQYPHADAEAVGSGNTVTVFNVAGNKYRLIVAIHYRIQTVFIRDFLTHAEYSKQAWKGRH